MSHIRLTWKTCSVSERVCVKAAAWICGHEAEQNVQCWAAACCSKEMIFFGDNRILGKTDPLRSVRQCAPCHLLKRNKLPKGDAVDPMPLVDPMRLCSSEAFGELWLPEAPPLTPPVLQNITKGLVGLLSGALAAMRPRLSEWPQKDPRDPKSSKRSKSAGFEIDLKIWFDVGRCWMFRSSGPN